MNGGPAEFEDEETVWKGTRIPKFENLESVLRCAICQEFLTTPMMFASCAHNFCSLCIRRWLLDKTECPSCRQNQNENSLHYNRELELVVKTFRNERNKLLSILAAMDKTSPKSVPAAKPNMNKMSSIAEEKDNVTSSTRVKKLRTEAGENSAAIQRISIRNSSQSTIPHLEMVQTGSDRNGLEIPPNSCQKVISVSKSQNNLNSTPFSSNRSNSHNRNNASLQASSLSSSSGTSGFALAEVARERMPKLAYNLLKNTQLKQMVKELKLPTDGDRNTLTFRHREYTLLYNAAIDAQNGMKPTQSHTLLAKEIRRRVRENERRVFNGSKNQGFIDFKPSGSAQTLNGSLSDNLSTDQNFKQLARMIKNRKGSTHTLSQSGKTLLKKGKKKKKSSGAASNSSSTIFETSLDWRVVLSCRTNKIFYFNSKTKKGQFERPPALDKSKLLSSKDLSCRVKHQDSVPIATFSHEKASVEEKTKENDTIKTELDGEVKDSAPWVCTFCTFINESVEESCEVCLKERPIASRRPKRQRISASSHI